MNRFVLTIGISLSAWGLAFSAFSQSAPVQTNRPGTTPALIAHCSACHQAPGATAQPDMKSWIRLLYTSACPDVTVQLTEPQRVKIKTELQAYFDNLKK